MFTSITLTRLAKTKISESININLYKYEKIFIPLVKNSDLFSSRAHDLILPNVKQDFINQYAIYQKYHNKRELYETLDISEILNLVTKYYDAVLPRIYLKFYHKSLGNSKKKIEFSAPSTIRISAEDSIVLSKWHYVTTLNNNSFKEQINKKPSVKQIRYIKVICRTLDLEIPNINSSAEASRWISTYQNAFNYYTRNDRIDPYLFEKF